MRGQGGWMVKDYLVEIDDNVWLEFVQNFRVTDQNKRLKDVGPHNFEFEEILSREIIGRIAEVKSRLLKIQKSPAPNATQCERDYLQGKIDDRDICANIESFFIQNNDGAYSLEFSANSCVY